MFKKNLVLIFSAVFLFNASTGLFCEDNILSQDQNLNLLTQEIDPLDENLTYTTEFKETDVFENNSSENETVINDEDEIDFDDLNLDDLDDSSEMTFSDKVKLALAYFKYAATDNVKENAKWYMAAVLIAGSAAATFAYYKFIKKN